MRILLIVLGVLILSCDSKGKSSFTLESGVQESLAQLRKKQIDNVNYKLSFAIPDSLETPIDSKLDLTVNLIGIEHPLYLDFAVAKEFLKQVTVNGGMIPITFDKEHITIDSQYLKVGVNVIVIDFTAGELSLNRNKDYLYTLLVPDRARTLFPCFDQPNIKATYDLSIATPKNWEVLAGGKELSKDVRGSSTQHTFATSDLMSTYLFSFVAGDFKKMNQEKSGMDMTLLYRENDEDKITYSRDRIFDLHAQSLKYLIDYAAVQFPFQKLDYATIPGFQYGGMEHIGAIQYRESSLFLDESATTSRILGRAKLIAHETAHMWFGDLVTMNWFNDVWMKEVFANFMADKIVNPNFPDINHKLAFMTTHYPRAYSEDRTLGTNPIRQELDNLNNAGSLYGAIIYNKAPIMMRQLEKVMGENAFREGIRAYLKKYQHSNATWPELVTILDSKTDRDIKQWSNVWVNASSRPIFNDTIETDENGIITSASLTQSAEDGSTTLWPQTFEMTLVYASGDIKVITINIIDKKTVLKELLGLPNPDQILYNSDGFGYGIFPTTTEITASLPQIQDDVTRGYAYINTYENVLSGNANAYVVLDRFRESVLKEPNELLVNLLSGYINSLFWKYLSSSDRDKLQPKLAEDLWSFINDDNPAKLKKTMYNTFTRMAYDQTSIDQLYKVWNKSITINNLKLNDDDYTRLASTLALYGHKESDAILAKARTQLTNPDKLAKFDFIKPSLSGDQNSKEAFFNSLKDADNRSKESWVQTALSNLNHPLYQEQSLPFLRPSLDLLEEVQATGDIFFPKGWLNSTIGMHTSPEAYKILEAYIDQNPNLKPTLSSKLLQATDNLRRVNNR